MIDEDVVISGVGGHFPECDNIQEFRECLMNNIDVLTVNGERWKPGQLNAPARTGKVTGIDKFDTSFFGMHRKLTDATDPMSRIIMERVFEAIVDAGMNPNDVRGTRTAVFIGSALSESENIFIQTNSENGFGIMGHNRSMMANRISYYFDFKGPSYAVDCGFCSGMESLEMGLRAVQSGECDMAIVGCCTLSFHAEVSYHYNDLGLISQDGYTHPFDENANGWGRAESLLCMVLQPRSTARRIYASLVHVKVKDFGSEQFGKPLSHNPQSFAGLLREFYDECGVSPKELDFVETEGAGLKEWDEMEISVMDEVICSQRTKPLMIGTYKGNIGHPEASSDLVALSKVIIAMELGIIPATRNCFKVNPNLRAITEGRLQLVTEHTPWNGGLVAINSLGLPNLYGHALLRSHTKPKALPDPSDTLPRLLFISAREEGAMDDALKKLDLLPADPEYARLVHDVFSSHIPGHLQRAYTFLPKTEELPSEKMIYGGGRRPVWFVYSGMGSQWPGMAKDLLKMPVFRAAIEKCHSALLPHGVDLMHIVTTEDASIFDNILHSFVGIAAVQIGLTDLLLSMGIKPDGIIGHSVGELGCAYADGCFTAEQMILAAHARGRASIETELIRGTMAAVGLGYKEVRDMVPETIEVACHNSVSSSTISGPAEDMQRFVTELKNKGVFAKAVNVSNIAYHSRYIAPAGPKLLELLKEVIPDPKPRSSRWVSTSVPKDDWHTPMALTSSAEYHTNNLLSSVLFEEGSRFVPPDAIAIEIAPHGLLQAILRRALENAIHVPLTKRGHADGSVFFLQAVGKMYLAGMNPKVEALYPPVEYPVGRGTPTLSPLVAWDHTESWYTGRSCQDKTITPGETHVPVKMLDYKYRPYKYCSWKGRNILTPGICLDIVAERIYKLNNGQKVTLVFENVHFYSFKDLVLDGGADDGMIVYVMYQRGSGKFELSVDLEVVARGVAKHYDGPFDKLWTTLPPRDHDNWSLVNHDEIYDELSRRGLEVDGKLKALKDLTISTGDVYGHMKAMSNMLVMDTLIQVCALRESEYDQELSVVQKITRVVIDPDDSYFKTNKGPAEEFIFCFNEAINVLRCAGVELRGLELRPFKLPPDFPPILLDQTQFVNYADPKFQRVEEFVSASLHVASQQLALLSFSSKLAEMLVCQVRSKEVNVLDSALRKTSSRLGNVEVNAVRQGEASKAAKKYSLLVSSDKAINDAINYLNANRDGIVLLVSSAESRLPAGTVVILQEKIGNEYYVLFKSGFQIPDHSALELTSETKIGALEIPASTRTYLVWRSIPPGGIPQVLDSLRQVPGCHRARCVFILDKNAPPFNPAAPHYARHLSLDLSVNILHSGSWGNYLYLPMKCSEVTEEKRPDPLAVDKLPVDSVDIHFVGLNQIELEPTNIYTRKGSILEYYMPPVQREAKGAGVLDYSGKCGEDYIMGLLNYCDLNPKPDPILSWEVPDFWSLEDAATIPFAYSTAYMALLVVARLRNEESVLIHDGWSAVGQAALDIALGMNCPTYTTYRTEEELELLKERYPSIPEGNFFSLQEEKFEIELRLRTKNDGVRVLLSTLKGEGYFASLRCLAINARFVQLNSSDIEQNIQMGTIVFLRSTAVFGIKSDCILTCDDSVKMALKQYVSEGMDRGVVRPLDRTLLPVTHKNQALRYLQGDCTDKVVLEMKAPSEKVQINESEGGRFECNTKKSYLIIGGSSSQWLQMCEWLLVRGARNVLVAGLSGPLSQVSMRRLGLLRARFSANVATVPVIIPNNTRGATALVQRANNMSPLAAIFILPMARQQAAALTNLDTVTRTQPDILLVSFQTGVPSEAEVAASEERNRNGGVAILVNYSVSSVQLRTLALDDILTHPRSLFKVQQSRRDDEAQTFASRLAELLPLGTSNLESLGLSVNKESQSQYLVSMCGGPNAISKENHPTFLIPGITQDPIGEMQPIAKYLYSNAILLSPSSEKNTISEIAKDLLKEVYRRQSRGPYTLVGRGFGCCVALELAHELELAGERSALFLIDGSIDTVRDMARGLGESKTFESRLLCNSLLFGTTEFDILERLPSWIERQDRALDLLGELSTQKRRALALGLDCARSRLLALQEYVPTFKLNQVVVTVIRPHDTSILNQCGMEKLSAMDPQVFVSRHASGTSEMLQEAAICISKGVYVGPKPMHLLIENGSPVSHLWAKLR